MNHLTDFDEILSQSIDPDLNYFNGQYQDTANNDNSKYFSVDEFINQIKTSPSNLTLVNFNIRSFHANSDSFFCLFDDETLPEIIILTETWFDSENAWNLNGYKTFHTIRASGRSGGVSIAVKNNLNPSALAELSFCDDTIEICSVKIIVNNSTKYILGIYRPHSDTIENFNHVLCNILDNRLILNKPIIIADDLNVNILSDCLNSVTFINNFHSYHFIPLITKPTRFSSTTVTASLLDQIWTNELTRLTCGIVVTDITDHYMTFLLYPFENLNDSINAKTKIMLRSLMTKLK